MSKHLYNLAVVILMAVMAVTMVSADGLTLISRVDAIHGQPASFTSAVITSDGLELWGIGLNTFPCYEVGKVFPVKTTGKGSLALGGYISWWAKADQLYLEPFACYSQKMGKWNGAISVGGYVPLNGGSWVVFVPEASATTKVGKGVSAGPAVSYWDPEGSSMNFRAGALVKASLSSSASVTARYLFGVNGEEDAARLQLVTTF